MVLLICCQHQAKQNCTQDVASVNKMDSCVFVFGLYVLNTTVFNTLSEIGLLICCQYLAKQKPTHTNPFCLLTLAEF